METLLVHFEPGKKDLLFAILKELSFVGEIELIDEDLREVYSKGIHESENDVAQNRLISQSELSKEINSWRKK